MSNFHLIICFILIFSSFLVAFSINPIQSVLFLIFTFCSAGAVLVLFHSEFLGLTFIIVYVGAIAVLFLFVIMMLNVKSEFENNDNSFINKTILYSLIGVIFYFFFFVLKSVLPKIFAREEVYGYFVNDVDLLNNIDVLGQTLYNYYFVCFLLAGLLLLIALIGAIVLTLKFNEVKKLQLSTKQLSRSDKFLSFF